MAAHPFSLEGKTGIVTGLANADSIAYGCAKAMHEAGAEMIVTYGSPKAEKHITPLAPDMGNPQLMLCDVQDESQVEALFAQARERWGKLDFLIHSMAFATRDDLHGRVVDCSREGFGMAMDVSCHSFMRLARQAEPLMKNGGTLITMSYYGADKVVENYNLMGPVKAALEASVRYMADELGPAGIRVHAISPGPIRTRAASGIKDFENLAQTAEQRSPLRRLVSIEDVGRTAVFLTSEAGHSLTGGTTYVDAGDHVKA